MDHTLTHRHAVALRRLLALALVWLALLAAGCAALPAPTERLASVVREDVHGTALDRVAAASTPPDAAGQSGFRLLPDGDHALAARLALIARAERSIDVQTYLLAPDGSGRTFVRALRDAASRGVRVRLLVDDLHAGNAVPLLAALAALPNAEVRLFNPLPVRGGAPATRLLLSLHQFERVNRRMHNKLFVADNRIAIAGGRNVGDEYFMRSSDSQFVDMDLLTIGPVVAEMSSLFDRFWNHPTAWPLRQLGLPPADDVVASAAALDAATPPPEVAERDSLLQDRVADALAAGRLALRFAPARLLADSPARVERTATDADSEHGALDIALGLLTRSREEVMLASPYFIPVRRGLAMIEQAIARGVKLRVVTNSAGGTDEPLAHWWYARYRERLVELGVEVHELSPALAANAPRMGGSSASSAARLHGKLAVADRSRVLIGSMNMDNRSARLNTELGLMIDSPELARELLDWCDVDYLGDAFRVRRAAGGRGLEWVAAQGETTQVFVSEPELGLAERLRLGLLSWLVSEDLL